MKKVLIVIVSLLLLAGGGFIFASMGLSEIKSMVVQEVDLSKISDGDYIGKFHKARWNYDVKVTVKHHRIVALKTINDGPLPGKKIVEGVFKEMIEKQSILIDAVSGASVTTKAFQKAVENALTEGIRL